MKNETVVEVEIQCRYAPLGSKEMQGEAHLPTADSDKGKAPRYNNLGALLIYMLFYRV